MADKSFKSRAPFGIATKRFNKLGFHPQLDVSGAMKKQITKVGPGSYNPKEAQCKSKKGIRVLVRAESDQDYDFQYSENKMRKIKLLGGLTIEVMGTYSKYRLKTSAKDIVGKAWKLTRWKTKMETELFSKFLDYRNANILYERELIKTLRGPGTNDLNENLFKRQDSSVLENIGFGTGERFKDDDIDNIPPPNTYHRNIQNLSTINKKEFSNVPTFEYDGFADRFKSTAPTYTLAPNRYHIQDRKGIDAKLWKIVSLRGPYDLFTGPRDESTIKNHFGPSNLKVPDYFFVEKNNIDILLHHPSKSKYGKFLKGARFTKKPTVRHMLDDLSLCYRNPAFPGPAHYNLSALASIHIAEENKHAFNTSKENARPPPNWTISPGPGRYTPKAPRCMKLKRPSWVFLSKIQRNFFNVVDYNVY